MDTYKQFNLYAGIKGVCDSFYQYTSFAEDLEHAEEEARTCALEMYEEAEELNHVPSLDDHITETMEVLGLDPIYDTVTDEIYQDSFDNYVDDREGRLVYKAVLTSEDTIQQDDLIIGCTVDDESDEVDGEGE